MTDKNIDEHLLEMTLKAAAQDQETVRNGVPTTKLIEGVMLRPSPVHRDARGEVAEIFDPRWNWHPDPMVFCYYFTIRPGVVKGWGLHKLHQDRYFVVDGEMEVVMFDPRPNSSTYGHLSRVVLSAHTPTLMNVPEFVWHADRCLGPKDVKVVNFPTIQYNHAAPDKYRLPLDTDLIPFDFTDNLGW